MGRGDALRVESGEGRAKCPLKNFTIMPMLKHFRQFALLWSREKPQSTVGQPTS